MILVKDSETSKIKAWNGKHEDGVMRWFKFQHHHHWRVKADNTVSGTNKEISQLIVEDCHCGAVRTIEIKPFQAPIIRIAKCDPGEG